ncbi:Putative MINDY deubiquitinase [Septoria linicola]|uniref:MINDY deubiquitinase n=1 Tax=Septoria linicola TaxID=215465 RepID=A0A9Q9EHQ5_9PEZI|nr:putative MINDY deubiquitinase [Septoria linicola]USW51210.1 Putative MINDY deubiquitinase [Septoria linicola]
MVSRKPVTPTVDTAQANAATQSTTTNGAVPYPTTPTKDEDPKTASSVYSSDLNTSPAFDLIDMNAAREKRRRDSDVSSHGTWDSDDTERDVESPDGFVEIPQPLRITPSNQDIKKHARNESELPSILRPGPAKGAVGVRNEIQKYDAETQANPWALESNNPYHKQNGLVHESTSKETENSQPIWQQPSHAPPAPPSQAPPAPPVELPTVRTPADELSHLSLGDKPLASPTYQTAEEIVVPQQGQPPFAPVSQHVNTLPVTNPWAESKSPSPPPPPKEAFSAASPEHGNIPIALPGSDSPAYFPAPPVQAEPAMQVEQQPQYAPPPGPPPGPAGPLIDHVEPRASRPPPPISTDLPVASSSSAPVAVPETPRTQERKRNEHYQIKHINWQDRDKMRSSPVLTQNENGPCPLLALVNALVLSTPLDMDTPLVETLRTREQVSLGLLLDAVFDELMSGRRGDTAHSLPDVSELYAFLLALHTGMNVNPRFITPVQTPRGSYDGHPKAMNGVHPLDRAQNKPGSFEETREMRLYSTFNIPLIHGWTAPKDTPVYHAFERNAKTFEDAQNIQFAEAELEHKQRTEGLNFQEQQMLEDIITIKGFLNNWPTQLTDHGLESISQSLQSGQIAILFRNDHFSTLYKEPRHGALMTLVTDQGYGSHAEIVWESLVDVNGAASEHFSGDFRSVSHGENANLNQGNSGGGNEGWETVQSRTRTNRPRVQDSSSEVPPPLPGPRPTSNVTTPPQQNDDSGITGSAQLTASEQEDHDLALALQLQEEEEDQQRQADERRRRERELSERYLSGESNERPPQIPPRRNQRSPRQSSGNIPVSTNPSRPQGRPAVNRPADASNPDAPPTYEQSSHDRPYRPAGATANPAQGNPLNTLDHLRRQSAYAQQSSTTVNSMPGHNRRDSGNRIQRRPSHAQNQSPPYSQQPGGRVQGAATVKDTDERCVVM